MFLNLRQEKQEALERDLYCLYHHEKTDRVSEHGHSYLELTYIERGKLLYGLDGHQMQIGAGDYFIVDYGSRHAYLAADGEDFDHTDFLFYPEFIEPSFEGTKSLQFLLEKRFPNFRMNLLTHNPARMIFHDGHGKVARLLALIAEEDKERRAGSDEMIACYLAEILLLALREIDGARAAFEGHENANRFAAYIACHYAENVTLEHLAQEWNYSLPYISRLFREEMGVSFIRYLQRYRVVQGCRLLSTTKMPLDAVAEAVGYRDEKFFASLLKKETGLTPSAFRRRRQ